MKDICVATAHAITDAHVATSDGVKDISVLL